MTKPRSRGNDLEGATPEVNEEIRRAVAQAAAEGAARASRWGEAPHSPSGKLQQYVDRGEAPRVLSFVYLLVSFVIIGVSIAFDLLDHSLSPASTVLVAIASTAGFIGFYSGAYLYFRYLENSSVIPGSITDILADGIVPGVAYNEQLFAELEAQLRFAHRWRQAEIVSAARAVYANRVES